MKKVFLFVAMMFAANLSPAQWEPDVRLTNDPAISNTSNSNARLIEASGDTLHVIWYDTRDGHQEIYYKRSTDGGITWGADTRLTNINAPKWDPCILVSGSVVHVAWTDDRNGYPNAEIYYKRSEDGGSTWGADTRLTHSLLSSESPSMAISGSVLHVVWYDDRNDSTGNWYTDIYYKRSTDGGLTWGPDIRLTTDPHNYYSGFPCIVVSGSVVHVAWEDERNGFGDIYYKRSTDGGLTWGADTRLTNDPADQYDPCLSVSGSVVHVVWHDNRNGSNNNEIYYKRSTDSGITWEADTRLTNNSSESLYPTIASSGSKVHVVWEDYRDGNYEIYYKQSVDAGLSWGADTRLTNASNSSQMAFIALSDSVVHVAWNDKRDGNWEIYYKRNPTGNVPVGIGNDLANDTRQQISIYPNPASNSIHINFKNYLNLHAGQAVEKTELTIRNFLGEELLSEQITNGESVID
ncbi:MAG: exo-alpha-sialidase, partial [Bacteroidetes bacterium]